MLQILQAEFNQQNIYDTDNSDIKLSSGNKYVPTDNFESVEDILEEDSRDRIEEEEVDQHELLVIEE